MIIYSIAYFLPFSFFHIDTQPRQGQRSRSQSLLSQKRKFDAIAVKKEEEEPDENTEPSHKRQKVMNNNNSSSSNFTISSLLGAPPLAQNFNIFNQLLFNMNGNGNGNNDNNNNNHQNPELITGLDQSPQNSTMTTQITQPSQRVVTLLLNLYGPEIDKYSSMHNLNDFDKIYKLHSNIINGFNGKAQENGDDKSLNKIEFIDTIEKSSALAKILTVKCVLYKENRDSIKGETIKYMLANIQRENNHNSTGIIHQQNAASVCFEQVIDPAFFFRMLSQDQLALEVKTSIINNEHKQLSTFDVALILKLTQLYVAWRCHGVKPDPNLGNICGDKISILQIKEMMKIWIPMYSLNVLYHVGVYLYGNEEHYIKSILNPIIKYFFNIVLPQNPNQQTKWFDPRNQWMSKMINELLDSIMEKKETSNFFQRFIEGSNHHHQDNQHKIKSERHQQSMQQSMHHQPWEFDELTQYLANEVETVDNGRTLQCYNLSKYISFNYNRNNHQNHIVLYLCPSYSQTNYKVYQVKWSHKYHQLKDKMLESTSIPSSLTLDNNNNNNQCNGECYSIQFSIGTTTPRYIFSNNENIADSIEQFSKSGQNSIILCMNKHRKHFGVVIYYQLIKKKKQRNIVETDIVESKLQNLNINEEVKKEEIREEEEDEDEDIDMNDKKKEKKKERFDHDSCIDLTLDDD